MAGWVLEHHRGRAADLHARSVPEPVAPALWWFDVERPALVLGSTQDEATIDRARAAAAGVDVARRRSGGGAVLVSPVDVTWVDVILPATDPRWDPDVGRSFRWLGDAWVRVLADLGVPHLAVHDGPLVSGPWSDRVCFGGIGPGEVLAEGRKVVGISQRRTRTGARFQCAVLHRWEPARLVDLLALAEGERARATEDLAPLAVGLAAVAADPAGVVERLLDAVQA